MRYFFYKYLYLPIWWLILGRPVKLKNFEHYSNELEKITEVVTSGETAIVKINGIPARIYLNDDKKITIEAIEGE